MKHLRLILLLGLLLPFCGRCDLPDFNRGLSMSQALAAPAAVQLQTLSNLSMRVPPAGRWVNNYVLAANTAKTITVPDWANYVNLSGTALWVNWTGAQAAVPNGDTTDGSGAVLNTGVRFVGPAGGDLGAIASFQVISAIAQEISVECWK